MNRAAVPAIAPRRSAVAAPVDLSAWATAVLETEAAAITRITADPPPGLSDAIRAVAEAVGPVLCCGVGKSGLVAAKVAATLSSLGTPAFPLSAGDAAHGDLGAVTAGATLLLFSNSGATAELIRLMPSLRARACTLIALVGRADSPLATGADIALVLPVAREADHIGMAPTASTTVHMAVGDAIAVAASRLKGFTRADFAASHPAGSLGQQALPVTAIMHTDVPTVLPHSALSDTIGVMSAGRMGAACVTDWEGRLAGLIVDGDIRRAIQARADLYAVTAASIMRTRPITLPQTATVGDAIELMRAHGGLLVLPVTDDAGHLTGMIHSVDLVQSQ